MVIDIRISFRQYGYLTKIDYVTWLRELSVKQASALLSQYSRPAEESPSAAQLTTNPTTQVIQSDPHWQDRESECRVVANQMALPMFVLSLLFLALVALLITTQVYVPRLAELSESTRLVTADATVATVNTMLPASDSAIPGSNIVKPTQLTGFAAIILLLLWPVFWLEHFYNAHAACKVPQNRDYKKRMLAVCLCPPLRLGATSPAQNNRIWLPGLGWREPGRQLCKELQQKLSMPMLVIAMMILPVLLTEKFFSTAVAEKAWLRIVLHTATGFVWLAFTAEFIVMVNSSAKKMAYIKSNWIDLAIILLPLISFLRSFSLLGRLGRAYRMRGIIIKTVRALTLLEVADRLMGSDPAKKLNRLQAQHQEKAEELEELREEIVLLEAEIASR